MTKKKSVKRSKDFMPFKELANVLTNLEFKLAMPNYTNELNDAQNEAFEELCLEYGFPEVFQPFDDENMFSPKDFIAQFGMRTFLFRPDGDVEQLRYKPVTKPRKGDGITWRPDEVFYQRIINEGSSREGKLTCICFFNNKPWEFLFVFEGGNSNQEIYIDVRYYKSQEELNRLLELLVEVIYEATI